MKAFLIFLVYAAMLVFDAAVLFGMCYLITFHEWSAWWMLPCIVIVLPGSNPKRVVYYISRY